MGQFALDPNDAMLAVQTGTEGMLSPLAHDLEITARTLTGEATDDVDGWTARLAIAVDGLHATGVLKRSGLDRDALSTKDRGEIERRIHTEVLRPANEIVIEA